MNAVENQVRELVKVELAAANEKFPPFHSAHEGWAVLKEEVEELETEAEMAASTLTEAWVFIKDNDQAAKDEIKWLWQYAINAACEAIQVAAMCQKFLDMEDKQ
ncbi:hypothetical protein H8S45_14915 [Agathobaculum sp. NSJ-28]|uniref:Uncharacterized protein n=1 Tax=Agathobaculum faecis TaxID=2763013 RepID=A0A923LZD2_9FIRM|nr:hypothetical protein [Agathobaculum faecis]MBC5726739.1 hypothetical protein [Agathobaculum faecis]